MARLTNGHFRLTAQLTGGESVALSNISLNKTDENLYNLATCVGQFKNGTIEKVIVTDNYELLSK